MPDFWEELAKLKGQFRLEYDRMIRSGSDNCCPICAVARSMGVTCGPYEYWTVALTVGLNRGTPMETEAYYYSADTIAEASDLKNTHPNGITRKIRNKILETVGLAG